MAAQTYGVLARVGRALGAREGTGPDDDPMLRALGEQTLARGLAEGHSRGLAEGRAEGLAEGRAQELAVLVRSILEARGMAFADEVSNVVADVPRDVAVAEAVTCTDAEDFRRRLGARRG